MDRFIGKLKKKTGSGRNKASKNKEYGSLEESRTPSPSLSPESKAEVPAESSFWHLNDDVPREAFETTLRPPVPSSPGDRHSNYRPYRRAPETPPAATSDFPLGFSSYRPHRRAPETPPAATSDFPLGFSSHPYESSKKSYPPPIIYKATTIAPLKIARKELPKREPPKNDKPPNDGKKIHRASATSKVIVHAVPQADNEPESEPEPGSSTRSISPDIEVSIHSVENRSLDSKTTIASPSKAKRTAQLLAKKYARLVHQQDEIHARKYMSIIHHREELESRGLLWPTSPTTHEFLDDDTDQPHRYEFPQLVPKPLVLRKQIKPQSDGPRPNQRQISNGVVHDYEAAKLESWKQFYEKDEMMQILHNEIDEYLGALMFERLLKETDTRQSADYRSEVTVRKYWDGVRGYLG